MRAPDAPAPLDRLAPGPALSLVGASFLLLAALGLWLPSRLDLLPLLVLTEAVAVLAPVLIALHLSGVPARPGLGLGWPGLAPIAGALLVAAGGFYLVAGGLEPIQERVAPLPPALREQLRAILLPAGGPRPLAVDLLAIGLLPAICEEALFRGALLRALAPAGRWRAVAAAALAFGLYHLSVYKLAPTAALGALFGALVIRSGSLWPAIAAHAANNLLVIVLFRAGYEDPPGASARAAPALFLAAAGMVVAGLRLCRPSAR